MEEFSIISDNCWGIGVYNYLNVKYTSPLINVIIKPFDYVKLVENFYEYLNMTLEFKNSTSYLGDIKIDFPHYNPKDKEKIIDIWNRRIKRISKNLYFKMGDTNNPFRKNIQREDNNLIKKFHEISWTKNKISFTNKKYDYENNFLILKEHERDAYLMGNECNKYLNIKQWLEIK